MPGIAQLIVVAILALAHVAPLGGAAHLVLLEQLGRSGNLQGLVYLAACVGILLAMGAYFAVDLFEMGAGVVRAAKGKRDPGARLAAQLLTATVLVAAIVFALPLLDFQALPPTPVVVGSASLIGGVFLLLLDRMSMTIKRLQHASFVDMIVVALAQLIAYLIPGAGRSSTTMTFARALGYERQEAARFSMLLGIPALGGLCVLQAISLAEAGALAWAPWLLAVAGAGFAAGFLALAIMMAWLKRHAFAPFALYRIVIGAVILVIAWQVPGGPPG